MASGNPKGWPSPGALAGTSCWLKTGTISLLFTASFSQPCWLYYFNVDDIGAAAKRVNAGGGRVLQGPIELPDGCWIVRCTDPQGALFALQGAWDQKRTERRSASEVGWSARWGGISSQGRVVLPKTKR